MNNTAENNGYVPYQMIFTPTVLYNEINQQGLTSIKGEMGAVLLYQALAQTFNNRRKYIYKQTLIDCGFNPEYFEKREISFGVFFLSHSFFSDKFEISINETVYNLKK